jgi:hypothetical protein
MLYAALEVVGLATQKHLFVAGPFCLNPPLIP